MQSKDSQDLIPFSPNVAEPQAGGQRHAPHAVEAVLIDFNGVLYENSAWSHWFSHLLRQVGVSATCDALFATFHSDYLHEDNDCEVTYWQSMRRFLAAVGLPRSLTDEVVAAGKAKRRKLAADARPLPGVSTTLGRLSASLFPLGVVCSRASSPQVVSHRLRGLGLHDWFRVVTCLPLAASRESTTTQLQAVTNDLNAQVAHTAYVSACPLALLGARAQGMFTIAFNAPDQAVADCRLLQFQHLTQVLTCERTRLLAG